eukprot:CAMPEP_0194224716 /NCGR_PEP_ID=MMETSP0156-20130528/38017_1 /TAXON_ID=33649 /ORGANISM="Thalassionema nitzschioides, Strain L26-B" /LENGTH=1183 /DNA_ID=CAMNT_0038956397 /DNA_START=8 /DNA_END=3559 /DNA_ORIENTATION=+
MSTKVYGKGRMGRQRKSPTGILPISRSKHLDSGPSTTTTNFSGDGLGVFDFDKCNEVKTPQSLKIRKQNQLSRGRNKSALSGNDPLSQAQGVTNHTRPRSRRGNRDPSAIEKRGKEQRKKFYEHLEENPRTKDIMKQKYTPPKNNYFSTNKKSNFFANTSTGLREKKKKFQQQQVVDLLDDVNLDENDHEPSSRREAAQPLKHPSMMFDDIERDDSFNRYEEEVNSIEHVVTTKRTETNVLKNYEDASPVNNSSNSRVWCSPDRRRKDVEEIDSPHPDKNPIESWEESGNSANAVCSPSKEVFEVTSSGKPSQENDSILPMIKRLEIKAKGKTKATKSGNTSLSFTKVGNNRDVKKTAKRGMAFLSLTESDDNEEKKNESLFDSITPKRKRENNRDTENKEQQQRDVGDEALGVLHNVIISSKRQKVDQQDSPSTADAALNIQTSPSDSISSKSIWHTVKRVSSNVVSSVRSFSSPTKKRKRKRGKPLSNTTLVASKLPARLSAYGSDKNDVVISELNEGSSRRNSQRLSTSSEANDSISDWTYRSDEGSRRRSRRLSSNKTDDSFSDFKYSEFKSTEYRRRSSRLSATRRPVDTKGSAHDVPIEIIDSDEEIDPTEKEAESIDLARVTLGSKYSSSDCKLILRNNRFDLCYKTKRGHTTHDISCEDVIMIQYCVDEQGNDDDLVLLILRARQTEKNGLDRLRKSLLPSDDDISDDLPKKGFIVLELRSTSALDKFLDWANKWPEDLCQYEYYVHGGEFDTHSLQIDKPDCRKSYAETMFSKIEMDNENRRSSLRTRSSSRNKNNNSNKTLVVFPFGGGNVCLNRATENLTELRQLCELEEQEQDEQVIEEEPITESKKAKARSHVLTIREEDAERLEFGEFLNDTLIDFWMQWTMRKEDRGRSPVHIFSSHFYSSLKNDGTAAVASWTAKKNIDIFSKRFVFIPINESLHWSLCVVVNPSSISNSRQLFADESDSRYAEEPASCILFLDSLKAHKKKTVARHVRRWLNSEWKRLKSETDDHVYTAKTMKVFSPRIPYQDNSWDCGVFVCRYAFALFMRRHVEVTVRDVHDSMGMYIGSNDYFLFGMSDIERIRNEMKCLISKLAVFYKNWLKEEKEAKAKAKLEEGKITETKQGEDGEEKQGEANNQLEKENLREKSDCGKLISDMVKENITKRNEPATLEL